MSSTNAAAREAVESSADLVRETFRLLAGSSAAPLPRHRHDLTRHDVRRTQTARILAAAIALFGDRGYAETTVAQIADRAGVSRRTVYDLYDSKEAVFLHTYRCTELLMLEVGAQTEGSATLTLDMLPGAIERILTLVSAAPAAARMFFLEALGAGPRVRQRRSEAIAEFVTALVPQLQRLRSEFDSTLRPLTFDMCNAVVAAAIELVAQHLVTDRPESLPSLANTIAALVRVTVTAA